MRTGVSSGHPRFPSVSAPPAVDGVDCVGHQVEVLGAAILTPMGFAPHLGSGITAAGNDAAFWTSVSCPWHDTGADA
jgi:hypothetical protein